MATLAPPSDGSDESSSDSDQFYDAVSSDEDHMVYENQRHVRDSIEEESSNIAEALRKSVNVSGKTGFEQPASSGPQNETKSTSNHSETVMDNGNASSSQPVEGFVMPQAPPRRKKKTVPQVVVASADSSSEKDSVSDGLKSEPLPTINFLTHDVASIQGDLSVNDAYFADRHSICVDDVKHEKPRLMEFHDDTALDVSSTQDKKKGRFKSQEESKVDRKEGDDFLQNFTIKNIDTGETLPLSKADELVTKCINPLNLHLMKLANEYHSDAEDTDGRNSMESSVEAYHEAFQDNDTSGAAAKGKQFTMKAVKNLKKIGRAGKEAIKGIKQGVHRHQKEGLVLSEQRMSLSQEPDTYQPFKLKYNKKDTADFDGLKLIQEINDCTGAIWCMKWSVDGQLLAIAGQDQLLRVYCTSKAWKYFTQLRSKASGQQTSPCSTKERSFNGSRSNSMSSCDNVSLDSNTFSAAVNNSRLWSEDNTLSEEGPLLLFSAFRGHTADVLDISWSKNHFILSSSMDKTVRLWHVTRVECLCTLRHADFVTTIQFHPRDDRYFLSGSLDGKLRLWNIPDKRVTLWNEVMALPTQAQRGSKGQPSSQHQSHGLITSSAFVQNGKFAVVGTYDGRVIFFSTDQLKYFTQLHVGSKGLSSALAPMAGEEKNKKRRTNKVTGIEGVDDNKILVTTNDSRIRLYDLRDLSLACKYKGCVNVSSQIKASVSHDSKYIVCGSENSSFYIWRMQENTTIGQRRDKNQLWESVRILPSTDKMAASAGQPGTGAGPRTNPGIITAATFAPLPSLLDEKAKYVIATADFNGTIRVFSK
ncbi:WD repeat-containing protein 44 [Halotydeus destructor]|nr:WD repeat-containing protein 44 [Halotydeus destructor]